MIFHAPWLISISFMGRTASVAYRLSMNPMTIRQANNRPSTFISRLHCFFDLRAHE
jgi:hypothetical protein